MIPTHCGALSGPSTSDANNATVREICRLLIMIIMLIISNIDDQDDDDIGDNETDAKMRVIQK